MKDKNTSKFEMVAKTFAGLEPVLAKELESINAENISIGRRMVSFKGDEECMYKANIFLRTALRILKPFYKDPLYAEPDHPQGNNLEEGG